MLYILKIRHRKRRKIGVTEIMCNPRKIQYTIPVMKAKSFKDFRLF